MRILLASPKGAVTGGIARWTGHILEFYNSLEDKKDVELIHFDTARKKQVPKNFVLRLFYGFWETPEVLQLFRRFVKEYPADILHMTSSASLGLLRDILMLRMAKSYSFKTIVHFRFGRAPELKKKKNWEWRLLCKVITLADKAIFIDQNSYFAVKDVGYSNIELLPNPISPKVNGIIEAHPCVKRDSSLILFVGHVTRQKGVFELIEASRYFPHKKIKFVGRVIDDVTPLVSKIQHDCPNVHFVGEEVYSEIIKDLLACSVFVLPSYTEGFPNVILEAMACGCAIVATSVGAIPEMLEGDENGRYGTLVNPQDSESLRFAIENFFADSTFMEECQINVKRRVNERYSMQAIWNQMEELWKRALCE